MPAQRAKDSNDHAYHLRSVHRVCDILDLLRSDPQGGSLTEVATVTELPKPSAFRYLRTLEARQYIARDEISGDFRLGPAFLDVGTYQADVLAIVARPHLETLRDQLGETVNLGTLSGPRVRYLAIVESTRAVRFAAAQGGHDPIHATALGKALAIQLSDEQIRSILGRGLEAITSQTITEMDVFLEELSLTRERGYALDQGENEPDAICVAVPLIGTPMPCAISCSAPASRLPVEHASAVADRLRKAAQRIARALAGQRTRRKAA